MMISTLFGTPVKWARLILALAALLSACGGTAVAPSTAGSPAAGASSAAVAKPAESAAASAKPAASAALTKVRFRYPVQTGAWIPFMVARDANIFQKYGLDVDVEILQSTLMVPAMLNKEMEIAGTSAETIVSADAKGGSLTIVGAMIPQALGFLVVTGDINKVEDLKGQTVVVNGFGNVAEFAMRRILAKSNLEVGKDVQIRSVQQTPAEIAALVAGTAKGFMAYPPDDVVAKRADPKLHSIYDVQDLKVPYVQASIFTTKAYLAANRPVVIKFLQATSEAIALEKKDKEFALKSFMKYAKLDDREAADRALSFYAGVAPSVVGVSAEGVQNVMDVVKSTTPEAANLDPSSVIDTSLTDEITKSGFANQFK
jgi:NitT/TauT family transport system substrate-binding protein